MAEAGSPSAGGGSLPRRFVGVVARKRTYANLLYLLLAFPLGFIYGWLLSFGFIVGILTAVFGIGALILAATIGGTRLIARFERWLANVLWGTGLRAPDDRRPADGIRDTVRSYVDAPSTWRALSFAFLKFSVGIVGVFLIFLLVSAFQFVTAPFRYPFVVDFGELNGEPVGWHVATQTEALALVPVGILFGLALLHVTNGVGYAVERMAVALLDDPDSTADDDGRSPVAVDPEGAADGDPSERDGDGDEGGDDDEGVDGDDGDADDETLDGSEAIERDDGGFRWGSDR